MGTVAKTFTGRGPWDVKPLLNSIEFAKRVKELSRIYPIGTRVRTLIESSDDLGVNHLPGVAGQTARIKHDCIYRPQDKDLGRLAIHVKLDAGGYVDLSPGHLQVAEAIEAELF